MTETVIVIAVISLIIALAAFYVIRQKRSGAKCIGCPHSKECKNKCKSK